MIQRMIQQASDLDWVDFCLILNPQQSAQSDVVDGGDDGGGNDDNDDHGPSHTSNDADARVNSDELKSLAQQTQV